MATEYMYGVDVTDAIPVAASAVESVSGFLWYIFVDMLRDIS